MNEKKTLYQDHVDTIRDQMEDGFPSMILDWIAQKVEAAYERGWHDQMYSHGRSQRPPTDTERAIDAGITERDYLARVYSKEQGLKS